MKFGPNQLGRPTPQRIAILFDFLAAICGVVSAWITTAAFISHNWSDPISSVLTGLLIPILLLAKRFYGTEPDSRKSIPIEDVKVAEEKK